MRGRRESFAWGPKFMELLPKLKAPEVKRIAQKCRANLKQVQALRAAAQDDPASCYYFHEGARKYCLVYKEEIGLWVVDPTSAKELGKGVPRAIVAAQATLRQSAPAAPGKSQSPAPRKSAKGALTRKPRKPLANPKPPNKPD